MDILGMKIWLFINEKGKRYVLTQDWHKREEVIFSNCHFLHFHNRYRRERVILGTAPKPAENSLWLIDCRPPRPIFPHLVILWTATTLCDALLFLPSSMLTTLWLLTELYCAVTDGDVLPIQRSFIARRVHTECNGEASYHHHEGIFYCYDYFLGLFL